VAVAGSRGRRRRHGRITTTQASVTRRQWTVASAAPAGRGPPCSAEAAAAWA